MASVAGLSNYRDVHPFDIPVDDLDLDQRHEWDMDAWIRADRSGYLAYVEIMERRDVPLGASDLLARFQRKRDLRRNPDRREKPAPEDGHPASVTPEQDRAGQPAPSPREADEEDAWQPSTSSTSSADWEEQAPLPASSERAEPRIRTFDW